MPRDYRPKEAEKKAKARRHFALARLELRGPSEPRTAPTGATSFPVKAMDPETQRLIDEALKRKGRLSL